MKRLQRLRQNSHLRGLCAETQFSLEQLIQPLFVVDGIVNEEEIPGLRDTRRQNLSQALHQVESDLEKGVQQFLLFPVPRERRERDFSFDYSAKLIRQIKEEFQDSVQLWVDTCLCSYTTHGHCCVFHAEKMDHATTLQALATAAYTFADAGVDGIAPSDMMDGRVAAIRQALDERGHSLLPIMSYSTKFASNFYGPFRAAAESSPKFGDRKQYQIDVRNASDALAASRRCSNEGADLLLVKPGMSSIDLIRPIQAATGLSVGAYQVSGEFAALSLLAEKGLISFPAALLETWHVFKRAGAQFIITYGARYAMEMGVPRAY